MKTTKKPQTQKSITQKFTDQKSFTEELIKFYKSGTKEKIVLLSFVTTILISSAVFVFMIESGKFS